MKTYLEDYIGKRQGNFGFQRKSHGGGLRHCEGYPHRKLQSCESAVPSGASTGRFEAVELRDGETRYMGLGVSKAVNNIIPKSMK